MWAALCAAVIAFAPGRAEAQAGPGPIHPPASQPATSQPRASDEAQDTPARGTWSERENAAPLKTVELGALTKDVSEKLNSALDGWRAVGEAPRKPRILVLDFRTWDDRWLPFGGWLAEKFSAAVAGDGTTYEVIGREKLTASLASLHLTEADEFDVKRANQIAEKLGADYFLSGRYRAQGSDLALTVDARATRVAGRMHSLVFVKSGILVSPDVSQHMGVTLDAIGPRWDDNVPGQNGVTLPKCVHCPPPPYSEQARKKKIIGSVLLRVQITVDGEVGDVELKKSLEPSLDQQAMNAVQRWKFDPAKDANGVPVEVHMSVQVTFRM
jgi:TonB family protein